MAEELAALSQGDIEKLMTDRSAAAQMDVAQKLTAHYTAEGDKALSKEQSAIANDIFGVLLNRAEVQVRAVLAMNLSHSVQLPADIARKMAADVNEVASPILEHSTVLSDEDLMSLIREAESSEKIVSEAVTDALVETKIESVVKTVVENEGAEIADHTFDKITERHAESAAVMGGVLQRTSVPVAVMEKVIERVSDTMRKTLEEKYGDLVELKELKKALDQSLELTSLKMLGFKANDQYLMRLINHLDSNNKLSPFSALCVGNLQLFEVSMARILRVPFKNMQTLLSDPGGFKAAYLRAELPESMYEAADLAARAIRSLEKESLEQTGFKQMCTPYQVMERMRMMSDGQQVEGLDYMFAMMQQSTRKNINFNTATG
jgi:uncharacterized protein (DUF2336 family)